jgi:ubiquinone/menaquinone biosynthesis C-methylase UbiE
MQYNQSFWSRYFKTYDMLLKIIPYRELLQSLANQMEETPHDKILDLGSGTGNSGYFIKDKAKITFFDQSKEALYIANSKFNNIPLVVGDITKPFPFEDHAFDKIISNNVLYTCTEAEREFVLRECNRVLKPMGKIVISNLTTEFSPMKIYRAHLKTYFAQFGILSGVIHVLKLLIPTIKMFWYNRKLSVKNCIGQYSFFHKGMQARLLTSAGFSILGEPMIVYADCAELVTGIKK